MLNRMFLAIIMALALALGPLAMPGEMAMAAAPAPPAAHHGEMAAIDHCDDQPQPQPGRHDKAGESCCVSCIAVADLPAPALEPAVVQVSRERPAPDRFRFGYLGEIATPPPRSA